MFGNMGVPVLNLLSRGMFAVYDLFSRLLLATGFYEFVFAMIVIALAARFFLAPFLGGRFGSLGSSDTARRDNTVRRDNGRSQAALEDKRHS